MRDENAPYGKLTEVSTPWGTTEMAFVYTVIGMMNQKIRYACVETPKTNPFVRYSVFRL